MKKSLLLSLVLLGSFNGTAFAQGASAPAATSSDPIVLLRADQRAANGVYAQKLLQAYTERNGQITAAVEVALKEAAASGKDPLVAKRNAESRVNKATYAEYSAKLKAAGDERKASLSVADKKAKATGK